MNFAIVIPAYNEEKRIGNTLREFGSYFNKLKQQKKLDYHILIVINGTTDSTQKIVKKYCKANKNLSYIDLKRGGKGYAIMEGFKLLLKKSKAPILGFVDGDLATTPQALYELYKGLGSADAAIASRYIKGAKVYPRQTLQRIIVSRAFNVLVRALFLMPFRDTQCGAKIMRRGPLTAIIPSMTISQWAFDVELLYLLRKKGFFICELPTTWSDRDFSKINFLKSGPFMVLAVLRLRLLNSPFKDLVRGYEKIFGNLHTRW